MAGANSSFMSDKPITQPLASSGDLDDRLRRTDEARWLASRYAPEAARRRLVSVWLLRLELQRALHASEPMLAKIRIQWWREAIEGLRAGTVRRHDLTEEMALACAGVPLLPAAIIDLVDRYDDVADDHLHSGGHTDTTSHAENHMAAERASLITAGVALAGALSADEFSALGLCGDASTARTADLPDAGQRWRQAQEAARRLRADLWPAIAHLAIGEAKSPLAQRWRMFGAVLRRRLPDY